MSDQQPDVVVILGGGVNGVAIARELTLCGVEVCLVDIADFASGATAYSSRLIHGGLRYLEYAEFALVRESLEERRRLLRLAPHLVTPLRLYIPLKNRFGGMLSGAAKFLGLSPPRGASRGYYTVGMGLWMYDHFADDSSLPRRSFHRTGQSGPGCDAAKFPWMCAYSDAQVLYPERLVIAMLQDARAIAAENNRPLHVFNYHTATLEDGEVRLYPVAAGGTSGETSEEPVWRGRPRAIINATGAWVDRALAKIHVPSPRLMGPTKGSHLVVTSAKLKEAMGGDGVYVEAADGRPVFILPLGEVVLVGTTDIAIDGDPRDATTSDQEIAYLRQAVADIFPRVSLADEEIELHYCGVRPLPNSDENPSAVTRNHRFEKTAHEPPVYSIIGGKLTTCRALAEQFTAKLLADWNQKPQATTEDRPLPGRPDGPETSGTIAELAQTYHLTTAQVETMLHLSGRLFTNYLTDAMTDDDRRSVVDTDIPRGWVRAIIACEWGTSIGDLVQRRLMLHFDPRLSRRTLTELAELLADAGKLQVSEIQTAVDSYCEQLRARFGKTVK